MNNLERPGHLPVNVRDAIMAIVRECPGIVFGGSIGLNAVGLLNRPVKDIDLMMPTGETLTTIGINRMIKFELFNMDESQTTTDVNGQTINRVSGKVMGVNVCIFEIDKLKYSTVKVFGTPINIQDSGDAIRAKRAYASKHFPSCAKHRKDLEYIDYALNQLV